MKSICTIFFVTAGVLLSVAGYGQDMPKSFNSTGTSSAPYVSIEDRQHQSPLRYLAEDIPALPGFRLAAARALPGVVHILAGYMPGLTKPTEPLTAIYDDALWTNPGVGASRAILGSASGVILTDDGLVLTCFHCVNNALRLEVVLQDRRVFKATVLATDSMTDIALLQIEARNLRFVQLGSYDSLEIGDWVMAVGYPLNLASTVTVGVVSAKARYMGDIFIRNGVSTFIQTDAVVSEGSSGGPLLDSKGKLVGVNSGIITTNNLYAGYSFAVPVNVISKICNDLLHYGKVYRVDIGASFRNVADKKGVRVASVDPGSPAQKAGLQPGDVLTALNGEEISCLGWLEDALLLFQPGDMIVLGVKRKDNTFSVSLQLAALR